MIAILIGQKLLRLLYRRPKLSLYKAVVELGEDLFREVLDVGGGPGYLLKALLLEGIKPEQYIVIELDSKLAEMGEINEVSEVVVGDAHNLPLRAWYGTVVFHDSLHHFTDPYQVLEGAVAILRARNSCIVIADINPSTTIGRIIKLVEKLFKFPAKFIEPEELTEYLSRKDLSIHMVVRKFSYIVTACLS